MPSRPKDSEAPLTQAAVALDAELLRYEQAAKELEATSITSEKTLQRARTKLEQCAELEQRLGAALRSFAEAMQATQARQQRCMDASRDGAERINQRFTARNVLLERMRALGDRAKAINEPVATAMSADQSASTSKLLSSLQAAGEITAAIIAEADALESAAKEDGWLDIERDTGTLKQQLQAARNKLLVAHRNVAGRSPS